MAKPKPNVSLVKSSAGVAKKMSLAKPGAAVIDFVFQDNQNDTCTVLGTDAAGNPVDISSVASITAVSDDTSVITVDPPVGVTFTMHATGKLSTPGTPVNITVVATWNDGSVGPFSFTLPCDVTTGPATGVLIVPGIPTVN